MSSANFEQMLSLMKQVREAGAFDDCRGLRVVLFPDGSGWFSNNEQQTIDSFNRFDDGLTILRNKLATKEEKYCLVKGCINNTCKGQFIGELCRPCYEFVAYGSGRCSQAYRNAIAAVKAELEEKLR